MATKTETKEAPKTETPADDGNASKAAGKASPLKKISIDTVISPDIEGRLKDWFKKNKPELEKHFEAGGAPIPLCRIWGKVTVTRPGTSNFGEYVNFLGQFEALSAFSGKHYRASKCLLPGWLEEEVDSAYSAEGNAVYFGYDIYLQWKPDASLGYEYVAEQLMETKDDLSFMTEQFAEMPLLQAAQQKLLPSA